MTSSTARCATRCSSSCFVLPFPLFLMAQSTGGRILGRVSDPSGAVLANVQVLVVNEATGTTREVQTSDNGDFVLVEVQPGSYRVDFEDEASRRVSTRMWLSKSIR